MRHNGCNCSSSNIPAMPVNLSSCNMPAKRYLEPVLVAKIYSQPIIEEYPSYSTSMDLDYSTNVSNYQYKPSC